MPVGQDEKRGGRRGEQKTLEADLKLNAPPSTVTVNDAWSAPVAAEGTAQEHTYKDTDLRRGVARVQM